MTLTLRLRTLSKPPRPNTVEVMELSKHHDFAEVLGMIDEAVSTDREFVVHTTTGEPKLVDPSLFQTIAVREEY